MNDILENYELRKKDLTFETWFIEGIQYNFKKVVKDDENKDLLLSFFKKHEHLFCDKNEVRRKKLVPIEYNKRIFRGI